MAAEEKFGASDLNLQPRKLREDIERSVPYGRVQFVDVQFTLANTDTPITHALSPATSDDVRYEVVRKDRACDVYEDFSPNRRAWTPTLIYLRCDTASARVRLKLFTERHHA